MGVKGLWRLVASAGKPVSLESLNGKILAVDVSIWLNKAAKGMRDKRGNAIYNAHLVLMFHRICKLLFYGIKPVFVFDGGVPELKKKTLRLRRERRSQADSNRKRTKDQILKNYLQTKALEAVTGVKSTTKLQLRDKKEKEDIFKLPEQPVQNDSSDSSSDDDVLNEDEWLRTLNESRVQLMFDKAEKLDTSSAEFNALPAEVKHELLTEIKDYQRRRYRRKNEAEVKLPQEAGTFSDFQLGNLMKRGQITHQIDELRKEMNSSMAAQFIELYQDVDQTKYKDKHIEGKRYVSNEKQGYVLIKKNVKDKSQNVLFQSSLDDDYARFKKREDDAAENPADVFRKLEREPARFQTIVEKNASRKRLKSDSSDEGSVVEVKIKVPRLTGPEAVTLSKDVTQDTAKDEVELMSASSSEESETDDTVNVTERKMEGICTAEKVPSKSALSKEVVEPTPNNQKEIVLLSNNDSSRESKTEASETFVGGKIDVSLAAKQEVKELTEISNDAVVTEPSSMVSAPSKMNSTVSRPPPNSIKIKSTSNTVDDSSAKISSANDGKIENVRNDKNIAVVTETNDFTKMSSSVTDNDNPSDAPPMIKPTLDLITDLITDKDTSTSLISPAISSSRTPSSNLSNPPETPMDSNEKDFPGEENIKQAEQQPAPSQPVSSQPAPSQPAPSQPAPQIPMEDLIGLQKDLEKEHDRLEDTTKKLKRQAATLSDETYQDVQELLRLFGIPYLVSPAEAEAQCAQLDFSKLTDGSITDDSDIFLFGGHRVYKNIFDQKKYAEVYLLDDLIKKLYLTREKLIALAFMTGSDYTEGIRGIGAVTGMEVLHEFNKNKPKETLKFFRDWLRGKIKDFNPGSNLKNKLRDVDMSQTFNSSLVWDAYLSPTVETSEEQFEWSNPDIDALKEYASEKLGWLYNKTDELLMPVLENMKKRKERQKTLMAYFQPKVEDDIETNIKSNRLKKVLSKMSSKDYTESEAGPSGLSSKKSEKPEIFFEMDDNDVDSDILKVSLNDIKPSGTRSTASASRPYNSKTLISTSQSNVDQSLPYIDDSDVVSKRPRRSVKSSEPSTSSTISSNEHVQAMKVANLVKAAAESIKPTTPYIAIQNVNNMVWNRMRGKNKQMKRGQRGGKSRRSKTTADLLEQVNTAKSSVQSSDSESDH